MGLILVPILTTQTLTVKPGQSLISQWDPNNFFFFFFPMRRVVWVCIKAAHLGCSTRVFRFGRQRAKKIIKHSFQFISHTRAPFYWLGPSYRALPGAGAATGIFLLYLLLGSPCIWCNITLLKYWIYIFFLLLLTSFAWNGFPLINQRSEKMEVYSGSAWSKSRSVGLWHCLWQLCETLESKLLPGLNKGCNQTC